MLKQWQTLPSHLALIIGAATGALICLWVIGLYAYTHTYRYLHTHSDNYGKTITSMVANQTIDAIINQDPISLQVILENVVSQPGVLQAQVKDINEKTIAQAGGDPTESAFAIYTASVRLNDSIAGSVSISLLPSVGMTDRQWLSLMLLATLLLLAILALGLYKFTIKRKLSAIRMTISVENTEAAQMTPTALDNIESTITRLNGEFQTTIHQLRAKLIEVVGYRDTQQAMDYSQRLVNELETPVIVSVIIEREQSNNLHQHLQQLEHLSGRNASQVVVNKQLLAATDLLTKIEHEDGPYIKIY